MSQPVSTETFNTRMERLMSGAVQTKILDVKEAVTI